jgi:Helix-turn-helix domain
MLHVAYGGHGGTVPRYFCVGAHINHGERKCISFGGLRIDEAVAKEVLQAISGNAVEAALAAAEEFRRQRDEQRRALTLEVEQAQYEARLAARRYDVVDPDNRLVAAELEARWNSALQHARMLEEKLEALDRDLPAVPILEQAVLVSLAQDLPAIWRSPTTDMRRKQRIVRILIHEIVADVDNTQPVIALLIHWAGGRHTELRVKRNEPGRHGRCTGLEAIEVVRRMAGQFPDEQIAATLNRLGLRTGTGNSWTELRVRSARHYHGVPAFDPTRPRDGLLTLQEAAERLGVSPTSVRRLITTHKLPARQVVPCALWEISPDVLRSPIVCDAVTAIKRRAGVPRTQSEGEPESMFSEG